MKNSSTQKMFEIFKDIMENEGATALTDERVKACCEENGVDYEKFRAAVLEEVMSVIGAHPEDFENTLPSELLPEDIDKISGGANYFQRGAASALAILNLCGVTQIPGVRASREPQTCSYEYPQEVASRRKTKKKKSKIGKTLKIVTPCGIGALLVYMFMHNNSENNQLTAASNLTTDSSTHRTKHQGLRGASERFSSKHVTSKPGFERSRKGSNSDHINPTSNSPALITHDDVSARYNGFLPEPSSGDTSFKIHKKVIDFKSDPKDFRVGALDDTLDHCKTFKRISNPDEILATLDATEYACTQLDNSKSKYKYTWFGSSIKPEYSLDVSTTYVQENKVTSPLRAANCAKVWLTDGRSLQSMNAVAARDHKFKPSKTALLNMANFFRAGGGVEEGCFAQEESLCRCTDLYPKLKTPYLYEHFYIPHQKAKNNYHCEGFKSKYLDYWEKIGTFRDCVYVPTVRQLKNDYGASRIGGFINNGPEFNVIVAAAPNLKYTKNNVKGKKGYRNCFKQLWRQIIYMAYKHRDENLVAGALGCGAFENDPKVSAETFFEVLMDEGPNSTQRWIECFKNIVLPIYVYKEEISAGVLKPSANDQNNYDCFSTEAEQYSTKYPGLKIERINMECPQ